MSKLFAALGSLKSEQEPMEVGTPLTITSPSPKTEAKLQHQSLKLVQQTMAPLALIQAEPEQKMTEVNESISRPAETVESPAVRMSASLESHLVALNDANSLGAEKFRALVTRLDHFRKQKELRSFQVTSSVVNEGKTLVAGNVAVTFAKYSGSKTLLIEGDLHRPTLASVFGLNQLPGLSHWWSGQDKELGRFVHRLSGMPLWFLPAGKPCDRPSDLLRSARFLKAFAQLASQFEWIVVDSTPMLPIIDVNLWSRIVDGALLVVRESVTPVKALKKGLQALDHPKLIGVVVNEATEFDQIHYADQYYGGSDRDNRSAKKR